MSSYLVSCAGEFEIVSATTPVAAAEEFARLRGLTGPVVVEVEHGGEAVLIEVEMRIFPHYYGRILP